LRRLSQVGMGASQPNDPTFRPNEIMEVWTDDGRVMTMINRKAIVRAHENPFDHGEKPFVRIVDYLNEHEFWGSGEIESIEGLQDAINAITNQRVDNIRLTMNQMYGVNTRAIEDLRDLRSRPGGVVRVKDDMLPNEAIMALSPGNVTP